MSFKLKATNRWTSQLVKQDYVDLGLLTQAEADIIYKGQQKRNVVASLISALIASGCDEGLINPLCYHNALENLAELRIRGASILGKIETNKPNMWTLLMKILTDILILIYAVGAPFTALVHPAAFDCFQLWVILSSFFLVLPLLCANRVIELLNSPYNDQGPLHDRYSVDCMLCCAEEQIFDTMRVTFDIHNWSSSTSTEDSRKELRT